MTAGDEIAVDVDRLRRDLAAAPDGARLRPLGLGQVLAGAGALDALAGVVAWLRRPGGGDVVVLAAATPMSAGGRDLRAVVERALAAHFTVTWVIVGPESGEPEGPGPGGLVHADQPTVAAARAAAARAGCVVTVGSGTITDIGKAAAPAGVPLVAVQTATSVNGYADPFSVLLRQGVKRTTPSRWPDALVIDPAVLADAPPGLNRAGAGDLMAMFTATADWYLASIVAAPPGHAPPGQAPPGQGPPEPDPHPGDPPYHPAVAGLALARGPRLLALAPGLSPRPDPATLAELAGTLTLSGIAMGVAGSTAPSSGMEHAISHLLEMAATARGRPGNLHGTQVGVASVVAARTWARVLRRIEDGGLERPARLPDPDAARSRVTRAFAGLDPTGAMAEECYADYARKLRRLSAAGEPGAPLAALRSSWPAFRAVLDRILAGPAELAGALEAAGLPVRFGDLAEPVDDATARWAVAACPLQRQRFGVADLAGLLGAWEEADVEEVLTGAARCYPAAKPCAPTGKR